MNITIIKLSDYSDYMQTHHLCAVRSGWREGKLAFVEVEPELVTLNKNQATVILNASDMLGQKTLYPNELKQFIGAKLAVVIETLGGWDMAVAEARRQWPVLV